MDRPDLLVNSMTQLATKFAFAIAEGQIAYVQRFTEMLTPASSKALTPPAPPAAESAPAEAAPNGSAPAEPTPNPTLTLSSAGQAHTERIDVVAAMIDASAARAAARPKIPYANAAAVPRSAAAAPRST